MELSVREMEASDIPLIANYWMSMEPDQLRNMGVDVRKLPTAHELQAVLNKQLHLPLQQRISFCTIWQVNGAAVGHCNTNPTRYGHHAFLHLHLWQPVHRKAGLGLPLLQRSTDLFFEKLRLQCLYSEPFAQNPAPNRTLERASWSLEKEYVTTPGSVNFEQPVKRWALTRDSWLKSRS